MSRRHRGMCLAAGWLWLGASVALAQEQDCWSSWECGYYSYCEKPIGLCDGWGTCQPTGGYCLMYWDPVCGCDGQTYSNAGCAAIAGVSIAHDGACTGFGCYGNSECGADDYCHKPDGHCGSAGVCGPRPQVCSNVALPVCGCDGHTYLNSCVAANAGVSVLHAGGCNSYSRADFNRDGWVDEVDVNHFLVCMSGSGVPQTDPACQDARLDGDDDVDQSDFGILQRCLSGTGSAADPACAG